MTGGLREVGLGLGSNIGDRAAHVRRAAVLLEDTGAVQGLVLSPLYRTAPWGYLDQAPFVNACAWGVTRLDPYDLLARVKALEVEIGRTGTVRWGPRVIDIDILYLDGVDMAEPDLILPHRDVLNRAFVLVPLARIRPARRIGGVTVAEAARRCAAADVVELAPGEAA